jgi:hypothetical protein
MKLLEVTRITQLAYLVNTTTDYLTVVEMDKWSLKLMLFDARNQFKHIETITAVAAGNSTASIIGKKGTTTEIIEKLEQILNLKTYEQPTKTEEHEGANTNV